MDRVSIWQVCVWSLIRLSPGSPVLICIGFSQFAPSNLPWPNYPHVFRLCLIVFSTSLWYLRSCSVQHSAVLLLPVDPLCTGDLKALSVGLSVILIRSWGIFYIRTKSFSLQGFWNIWYDCTTEHWMVASNALWFHTFRLIQPDKSTQNAGGI